MDIRQYYTTGACEGTLIPAVLLRPAFGNISNMFRVWTCIFLIQHADFMLFLMLFFLRPNLLDSSSIQITSLKQLSENINW